MPNKIQSSFESHLEPRFSVLFVDDEEKSRKYFNKVISKDYTVFLAASVNEALKILAEHSDEIGVLVTDQRMPGKQGTDLLQIMHKRYPGIVCLFTSAYTEFTDAVNAINSADIYRYLEKPWKLDVLSDAISSAMQLFQSQNQQRELIGEKQKGLYYLAGSLGMELRTPLYKISSSTQLVQDEIIRLFNLYKPERQQEMSAESYSLLKKQYESMVKQLAGIQVEAQKAQLYIDSLLMYTRDLNNELGWEDYHSMLGCLDHTLTHYPFDQISRDVIHIVGDDFEFQGSWPTMTQILLHLIKNSLESLTLSQNRDKSLLISTHSNRDTHILRIRDNGVGIPKDALGFIFNDFYTTKYATSMGVGLSYCRDALIHFNGKIECHSEEGEFAEFIISLPKESKSDAGKNDA